MLGHVGHILVTTPAQIEHHDLTLRPTAPWIEHPGHGVGALQGRQDALEPPQPMKRVERRQVGDRVICDSARVVQLGMFGTDARIIQTGRNECAGATWPSASCRR